MTDQTEPELRAIFQQDADRAPAAAGLAAASRERAGGRRRRRRAEVAGTAVAVAAVGVVAVLAWPAPAEEARPSVQPRFSGPLTASECPGGINGGTTPFYTDSATVQPPVEDQVDRMAAWMVLPLHPDATRMPGRDTASRREFVYVLPNGNRVAIIEFEPAPGSGWRYAGSQHC